ncbi:MAG: hypothetical protein EBR82_33315 [Caulobacteraceae bacterium]|nr:hypothetical protein [Caulobacteraceae bacterium]
MKNINISNRGIAVIRSLIHARVEQLTDTLGPGVSQGQQDYVRETVGELSQILHELRRVAGSEF